MSTDIAPDTASELDVFAPIPETVTLDNGVIARLLPLKTRQMFRLLRIVTRGAGSFLMQSQLSADESVESFMTKLVGLLFVAVPEAEQETIDFLVSMIEPDGLIENPTDKGGRERNETLWSGLTTVMQNPELDDTISLLEAVVRREAENIQSLGKRLQTMFALISKAGLTPSVSSAPSSAPADTSPDSTPPTSSADSPMPST